MHLPAQGAEVAVGTGALRENAELDGELHDFMPLREFTQPSIPPPSLSLSPLPAVFLALLSLAALMLHPSGAVRLSLN